MPAVEQVFLSGTILLSKGSNIVTLTTPYIRLRKESFLMQVDCIGGRRTPQGEALSGSSGSELRLEYFCLE